MKTKLIVIFLLFFTAIALISVSVKEQNNEVILRSYNNTVALYENGVRTKIFNEIVLNNLPDTDISDLKKGIIIDDNDELLKILEDFDG